MVTVTCQVKKVQHTSEHNKKVAYSDTENKLVVTCGEKEGEGVWAGRVRSTSYCRENKLQG